MCGVQNSPSLIYKNSLQAFRDVAYGFQKSISLKYESIGELKTSVVKNKPLIHIAEENKDEPHYHNVSGENFFEDSRITDLLFVIKQLKDGCTVFGELQNIAYLESETIIGLASIFYLKCICDNINAIYSG